MIEQNDVVSDFQLSKKKKKKKKKQKTGLTHDSAESPVFTGFDRV